MKESGSFFGRQNLIASDARLAHKDAVTPAANDSSRRGARRAVDARFANLYLHVSQCMGRCAIIWIVVLNIDTRRNEYEETDLRDCCRIRRVRDI